MSDSLNLQVLANNNREALLLAEAIGWLHDYRKCSEEHLQTLSATSQGQGIPRTEIAKRQPGLRNVNLQFTGTLNASRDVINLLDDRTWRNDVLGQYLARCHNTAHFDKQNPNNERQPYPGTQISSPFGFETAVATNLTNSLWSLPWSKVATISADREELREKISAIFSQTIADSRRPINEVDLWSWGSFVGALYKSALAGVLLTGSVLGANDLHWRLLAIRVDGLGYISNVSRIADLLARQKLLSDCLDRVRDLLEVTYPIGSEMYRDQNGSVYVVPDVPDLLEYADDNGKELRVLILETFNQGIDGEMTPHLELEQNSWWGQDPGWPNSSQDKLPNIRSMLTKRVIIQPSVEMVAHFWQSKAGGEVCPICRLRPMKERQEACETCLKRRSSRIGAWKSDPSQTIWIDEIADHNDRVALIVGKFGLDDWLSGDLVQTMLVRAEENNPSGCTPKNPSPARLRRVWETCQRFWTETVDGILNQHPYANGMANAALRRARVALVPDPDKAWREGIPYDGTINGQAISLFWLREENHFVTTSNLQLAAGKAQNLNELVAEWHGKTVHVVASDRPNERKEFTIARVDMLTDAKREYTPSLPLLSSPDQFLALVPAIDALKIAEKIHQKYQEQFGKIQNRLPLFLGLVFFPRKTPLAAVMDAARRMLEGVNLGEETWRVECSCPDNGGSKHRVRLSLNDERISLSVPTKMGDNTTEDVWYPYFFIKRFADGTPDNRARRFQYNGRWLVHVKDLQEGDTVHITPSRFAYLWLESTAQRFKFDPQEDVLLLDELPRLMEMWQAVCKSPEMSDTSLQAIHALLESKLQEWGLGEPTVEHPVTDEAFRCLVEATLRRDKVQGVTVEDVLTGRFRRCLDLHLHILKRRVRDEQQKEKYHERQAETSHA